MVSGFGVHYHDGRRSTWFHSLVVEVRLLYRCRLVEDDLVYDHEVSGLDGGCLDSSVGY